MNCFTFLLLASLVPTSLAILNEPEDEIHLEAQPMDACKSHLIPKRDHVSLENPSGNSHLQRRAGFQRGRCDQIYEETNKSKARAASPHPPGATTPEGKLAKLSHNIGKNLVKTMKETITYPKRLLPHSYEVTRP
ncbi:LOW QUALITY PROTEIN: glycosylation-dependent cell adhesion molecule 1-like [Mustela lutreola]|uniref:LOW QUALITY PROTEIN: glycosylation-dependent cell adhesion molecule 1-like n=1 Tax=Mustela lutreola TaxID=9666 RepID=UPI002797C641|nr:LOW QUALITY PROTEIN: glycosylation-dependent cell adhesion molecule 1-like [Mustela lutreola]